jgi:hypothetical protein
MRDIRASVEVRALIGAEMLRELHEDAPERYKCWQCGRAGRTTKPTSVIVLACRVFRAVKLAHAACADPHIIMVDAAGMRTVAAPTAVRNIASGRGKQDGSFAEGKPARQGGARHEDNVARAQARPGW